jgi:HK97 family phage prohead protease
MKYTTLNVKVKEVDAENFRIRAVFSTPDVDRHGEIVKQEGWKLDNFLKNPVVLWAHDMYAPAIGKVVEIGINGGNLEGMIQFAAKEYDFAATIFKLYAGEYVRAISVGFSNLKWEYSEVEDQLTLLENELYEVSCVNVPANALALAKSKGVDISPLEKRMERAKGINDSIMEKGTDAADRKEAGKDDDGKEKGVVPSEEVQKSTEELATQQAIDGIVKAADAIEYLTGCDNGTIKAAVRELTSRLDAAKSNQPRSAVGAQKKNSTRHINRIIHQLHKGKAKV